MLDVQSEISNVKAPSFWEGVASLYDVFNIRRRDVDYTFEHDYKNIYKDFYGLKHDFDIALTEFMKMVSGIK